MSQFHTLHCGVWSLFVSDEYIHFFIVRMRQNDVYQYVILYDASKISYKNVDFTMMREFINLAEYYPELLKRIFVIKPNWLFSVMVSFAKNLIHERSAQKIVIINDYSELFEYIEPDQIQKEFGGTSDFVYKPPC